MTSHLTSIEICDFRGFPVAQKFDLDGTHLLLYGENGSGKSSLFHAVAKLLNLSKKAEAFDDNLENARCLKNRFTDPTAATGHVTFTFSPDKTGATIADMVWQINQERPKTHPLFVSMARSRGCLDYRSILKTNFLHEEEDSINLFELIIETLLREIEIPPSELESTAKLPTFGEQYDDIHDKGSEYLELLEKDPEAMDDFEWGKYNLEQYDEEAHGDDEEAQLNRGELWGNYLPLKSNDLKDSITNFNELLTIRIGEIAKKANEFIKMFDKSLEINLIYEVALKSPTIETKDDWLKSPQLLLQAKYDRLEIVHPALFLNEARLTAIALAIYFAALKTETPDKTKEFPRLLVLDDVLVGLDMANRMPVLELIQQEFADNKWQVLLMTFDRPWYDAARQRLNYKGGWSFGELYAVRIGDYEQPVLIDDSGHIERAKQFLLKGEVKAAAVHVRTAYELVLKKACERLKIAVPYKPNPAKIPASDMWDALKSAEFDYQPPPLCFVDGKGKNITKIAPKKQLSYIPKNLVVQVEHSVSWILNPLSHSQSAQSYKNEITKAVLTVEALNSRVELAIERPDELHSLCQQIELLVRIVRFKADDGKKRKR